MKMTLKDARYCISSKEGGCDGCKFNKQEEFDCRQAAFDMAETAINYILVGKALSTEMENKDR